MNLAGRMRPQTLADFLGQTDLVGQGRIISKMIDTKSLFSIIFWGPPREWKNNTGTHHCP